MNDQKSIDLCVMVIDDQRTMRSIVRQLLHQEGIRDVIGAENGSAAIEMLSKTGRHSARNPGHHPDRQRR